ncbi:MAG: hypothetical protein AB4080_26015 [Trichodesmium sp.]
MVMGRGIFFLLRIAQQLIHLLKHPAMAMSREIFFLLRIAQQLIHLLKHLAMVMSGGIFFLLPNSGMIDSFAEAPRHGDEWWNFLSIT